MGVLSGIRIVEIAGLGPGPFCGMLLADLGADVIVVERPEATGGVTDMEASNILNRGKRSVGLDLKKPEDKEKVLRLIEKADGLIEGMRPGVMERLGLGPDVCQARNPRLVYGRMTGWGQSGPLAQTAGHDINYIGLSGALFYSGLPGQPPVAPPTLVGDLGGGALYLAVGLLAGILAAKAEGKGRVVDAAIVDGSAHLMNLLLSLNAGNPQAFTRGKTLLDGPHWFRAYLCADGKHVTIGPVEPKFYALLLDKLGLKDDPAFRAQYDEAQWPAQTQKFETLFAARSSADWRALLEGADVCFAPVLNPGEAAEHPHNQARGTFSAPEGLLQAAAAPRFSGEPAFVAPAIPKRGEHTEEVLREFGL